MAKNPFLDAVIADAQRGGAAGAPGPRPGRQRNPFLEAASGDAAGNPFLAAVIADAQRGGAAGAPGPRPGRQRNPFLEAASGDAAGNPFLAAAMPTPEVEAATPNIEPISFWDELGDAYTPDWPTLPPTTLPVPLGAPPAPMMPPAPPTPAEANQHSLAQAAAADATGAPKPPPTITWPAPPPAFTPPSVVADVARDPMTAAREFGRDLKQAFLPDKPDPVADLVNQPWWGEMSEGAQAELLAQATGGSLQQGEALRQRLQIGRLQTAGQEFLLQAGEGLGNALVGVSDVLPVPRLMEHFTGSNPSEEAGRFILDRAAKARENTTNPLYANDPVVAVAGGLGSTVPYFAAGGVSKLAGLGPKATLAVSGMFGAAQGAGAGKITAEMAEATDAQTRLRMLTGAITGSTEAIPLNRILRRFDVASGGLFTRNLKRYVGRPAAEAVESMVEEALQEIVQTYGDAAADEFILGLERDFAQDAVKGGAVGGAVGLILGTASSTARNRTVRRRAQRIEQGREARAVDQYVQRRFEQAPTGAGERVMDQAPPSMRRGAMPVTPEPRPAIDPDATIEAGGVAPAPRPVEQQRIQAPAGQRTDPPTPGTAPGSTAVASGPAAADSLGKPRVGDVAGGAVAEPRQPGGDGGDGAVGGEGRAGDREVGEAGPRGADGPAEGDRGARGRSAGPGRGDRPAAADLSPEDRQAAGVDDQAADTARRFQDDVRRATGRQDIAVEARPPQTDDERSIAQQAADLGVQVVFVERTDSGRDEGLPTPAWADPQGRRVVIERGHEAQAAVALFHHEWTHALERDDPGAFRELVGFLSRELPAELGRAGRRYAQDAAAAGVAVATDRQTQGREAVARLAEDLSEWIADPTLTTQQLAELARRRPTLYARVLATIDRVLAGLQIKWRAARRASQNVAHAQALSRQARAVLQFRFQLKRAAERAARSGAAAEADRAATARGTAAPAPASESRVAKPSPAVEAQPSPAAEEAAGVDEGTPRQAEPARETPGENSVTDAADTATPAQAQAQAGVSPGEAEPVGAAGRFAVQRQAVPAVRNAQGRLLAPNGEPSNLTEAQWHTVRTPAFKRWFGDWELPARQVKIARLVRGRFDDASPQQRMKTALQWALSELRGDYSNSHTGWTIRVSRDSLKEAAGKNPSLDHLNALEALPDLLKNAVLVESHADTKQRRQVKRVHRLYAPLVIRGRLVRVKLTVFEQTGPDHRFYLHELQEMTTPAGSPSEAFSGSEAQAGVDTISIGDLLPQVKDNVSRVTDANGEPLVVYHGTRGDHNEFTGIAGTYFSNRPIETYGAANPDRGNFRPVYLSLQKPLEWGGPPMRVTYQQVQDAAADGYDGIVQRSGDRVDYIAFRPEQIKSATGNRGTFEPNNPDIRFAVRRDLGKAVPVTAIRGDEVSAAVDPKQVRQDIERWARANLRGEYTNDDTGWSIRVSREGLDEAFTHADDPDSPRTLVKLPELLRNAVLVETKPHTRGDGNIPLMHTLYAPAEVGGQRRLVRLLVQEHREGTRKFYDAISWGIEKPDVALGRGTQLAPAYPPTSGSTVSIGQILEQVKRVSGASGVSGVSGADGDFAVRRGGQRLDERGVREAVRFARQQAQPLPAVTSAEAAFETAFPAGGVMTPAGMVRVPAEQLRKLRQRGRQALAVAIHPTLTDPAFVVEEGSGDRLYVKAFRDRGRPEFVVSVVANRGVMTQVSVHIKRQPQIEAALRSGTLFWSPTALRERLGSLPTGPGTASQGGSNIIGTTDAQVKPPTEPDGDFAVRRKSVKQQVREATGQTSGATKVTLGVDRALRVQLRAERRAAARADREARRVERVAAKSRLAEALQQAESKARADKAVRKGMRAELVRLIQGSGLAPEMQAKMLTAVRDTETPRQLVRAIGRLRGYLARSQYRDAFNDVKKTAGSLKLRRIAPELQERAQDLAKRFRALTYEPEQSIEALRAQMPTLEAMAAEAREIRAESQAAQKTYLQGKAYDRQVVVSRVARVLEGKKKITVKENEAKHAEAGRVRRHARDLLDIETLLSGIGGHGGELVQSGVHNIRDAQRGQMRELREHDQWLRDQLAKTQMPAGSVELHRAVRSPAAAMEDVMGTPVNVAFADAGPVKMTFLEMVALYAHFGDESTRTLLLPSSGEDGAVLNGMGVTFAHDPRREPVRFSRRDLESLADRIGPQWVRLVNDWKAHNEQNIRRRLFTAVFRLRGYMPEPVQGYFMRQRNRLQAPYRGQPEGWRGQLQAAVESSTHVKEREDGRSSPLLVTDFLSAVQKYHQDAARIIHLAEPVRDFQMTVQNPRVGRAITGVYGESANLAIEDFLLDTITGGTPANAPQDVVNRVVGTLNRNLARAVISLNISPMLKNLGGVTKLVAEFDPRDLSAGAAVMFSPEAYREMEHHSPLAYWRYQGGFARHTQALFGEPRPSLTDMTLGQALRGVWHYTGQLKPGMAWESVMQAVDRLPFMAYFDSIPLRAAWGAAKSEVTRTRPELAAGSREYFEAVASRFEEAVYHTQNGTSSTEASGLIRQARANATLGALTQFQSDASKSLNMIIRGYQRGAGHGARAAAAVALNMAWGKLVAKSLAAGSLAALIAAWYGYEPKDDEEKAAAGIGAYGWAMGRGAASLVPQGENLVRMLEAAARKTGIVGGGDPVLPIESLAVDVVKGLADAARAYEHFGTENVMQSGPDKGKTRAAVYTQRALERLLTRAAETAGIPGVHYVSKALATGRVLEGDYLPPAGESPEGDRLRVEHFAKRYRDADAQYKKTLRQPGATPEAVAKASELKAEAVDKLGQYYLAQRSVEAYERLIAREKQAQRPDPQKVARWRQMIDEVAADAVRRVEQGRRPGSREPARAGR